MPLPTDLSRDDVRAYHADGVVFRGWHWRPCTRAASDWAEAFEAEREAAVARAFGCTFMEANERGEADAFLALDATFPTLEDVLIERFGSPVPGALPTVARPVEITDATHPNIAEAIEHARLLRAA